MTVGYMALGGNLGDVHATFMCALERLADAGISIVQVSHTYQTAPVGDAAGDPFLNAAAAIETNLSPLSLLDRMHKVETALGRTREVRWGARTIDLDLILFGDQVIDESRLTVPHPGAWYRRFVLDPLVEIAADVVHPVKGVTIRELRARLLPRPLQIAAAGGEKEFRAEFLGRLRAGFSSARFYDWAAQTKEEPALLFWLGEGGAGGTESCCFDDLPLVPRLDMSSSCNSIDSAAEFARGVLQAALDKPVRCK